MQAGTVAGELPSLTCVPAALPAWAQTIAPNPAHAVLPIYTHSEKTETLAEVPAQTCISKGQFNSSEIVENMPVEKMPFHRVFLLL